MGNKVDLRSSKIAQKNRDDDSIFRIRSFTNLEWRPALMSWSYIHNILYLFVVYFCLTRFVHIHLIFQQDRWIWELCKRNTTETAIRQTDYEYMYFSMDEISGGRSCCLQWNTWWFFSMTKSNLQRLYMEVEVTIKISSLKALTI